MANIGSGLFKLAVGKGVGLALPVSLVAVAAVLAWKARNRRSAPPAPDVNDPEGVMDEEADAAVSPREAGGSADPGGPGPASFRPVSHAPSAGGADRTALLSAIIEENIRLREALK